MPSDTLGQRLSAAMRRVGLSKPADLARASESTTATISNWLNDMVDPEHVKAAQLFRIAIAAGISGHELLTGQPESRLSVQDTPGNYESHPVQLDGWIVAFQLVAEVLDDRGLSLPPAKRAEVTLLAHDLLHEGMPRAKVLRFVQAAAA